MGATGAADAEPTDAGKLAADIKSLFDRVGALEPRVAVSASPDGSVASATLGVDEVRPCVRASERERLDARKRG